MAATENINMKLTLGILDSDINALILDYLTAEGYPSAADKFSKEANLKPIEQQESVRLRNQIKHNIHLGSIQDAIEALNELNPQVSFFGFSYPSILLVMIIQVSCTTLMAHGSLTRNNTILQSSV